MSVAPWTVFQNPFPTPRCTLNGCEQPVFMMGRLCLDHLPDLSSDEATSKWRDDFLQHGVKAEAV